MYGSNYHGQTYYGQGPAVGTTFILQSVSATVTTTGSISFVLLINKFVEATITTTASINRQLGRTFEAVVATTASITSQIVKALNIRRAVTKIITQAATTRRLRRTSEE